MYSDKEEKHSLAETQRSPREAIRREKNIEKLFLAVFAA